MKAKLSDGFEVVILDEVVDDWGFLTMLRKIDKGDTGLIVDIAETLLGSEEEVGKLAKHLEDDGVTAVNKMVDALTELMSSVNELKNS